MITKGMSVIRRGQRPRRSRLDIDIKLDIDIA